MIFIYILQLGCWTIAYYLHRLVCYTLITYSIQVSMVNLKHFDWAIPFPYSQSIRKSYRRKGRMDMFVYICVCICMDIGIYMYICRYTYVCIRVSIFLFCLMHYSHLERGLDVSLIRSYLLRLIHGVPAGVRLFILWFNILSNRHSTLSNLFSKSQVLLYVFLDWDFTKHTICYRRPISSKWLWTRVNGNNYVHWLCKMCDDVLALARNGACSLM